MEVILSTDILSEGQNLQQAQAVLSFDMPWNPQRVVQRNGRIIRLRSPHDTAYLYTLLPKQGDLDRLLNLEAKLQAKIMAANASVGMETPVLADVETESQVYADLSTFVERLSGGDAALMDEQGSSEETGSAFAGELFRSHLRRAVEEGEVSRLQGLPWGIGAAFVQRSPTLAEPAVFFACRTRMDERYWRVVSQSGQILYSITETRDTNQIANYAYVEWKDNANIADSAPVKYLPEQQQGFTQSQLAQMYRLHALPTGWELMDYQKFLAARRELMAQIIREGYEKLSQGAPVELPTLDLAELIVGGESDYVEFNFHTHERDSRMEHVILRTLAGFLN